MINEIIAKPSTESGSNQLKNINEALKFVPAADPRSYEEIRNLAELIRVFDTLIEFIIQQNPKPGSDLNTKLLKAKDLSAKSKLLPNKMHLDQEEIIEVISILEEFKLKSQDKIKDKKYEPKYQNKVASAAKFLTGIGVVAGMPVARKSNKK